MYHMIHALMDLTLRRDLAGNGEKSSAPLVLLVWHRHCGLGRAARAAATATGD